MSKVKKVKAWVMIRKDSFSILEVDFDEKPQVHEFYKDIYRVVPCTITYKVGGKK